MNTEIHYREIEEGEEERVSAFLKEVFGAFIAPDLEREGVRDFADYASPEKLEKRSEENHFVLIAEAGTRLVGVLEMRNHCHLALLFVHQEFQRRGIGRALLDRALHRCRAATPTLAAVTVNAFPGAVSAYRRMGFEPTGPEKIENGIRFVPMRLDLRRKKNGQNSAESQDTA